MWIYGRTCDWPADGNASCSSCSAIPSTWPGKKRKKLPPDVLSEGPPVAGVEQGFPLPIQVFGRPIQGLQGFCREFGNGNAAVRLRFVGPPVVPQLQTRLEY